MKKNKPENPVRFPQVGDLFRCQKILICMRNHWWEEIDIPPELADCLRSDKFKRLVVADDSSPMILCEYYYFNEARVHEDEKRLTAYILHDIEKRRNGYLIKTRAIAGVTLSNSDPTRGKATWKVISVTRKHNSYMGQVDRAGGAGWISESYYVVTAERIDGDAVGEKIVFTINPIGHSCSATLKPTDLEYLSAPVLEK